ncbi:MAG: hypothetical protein ACFCBW_06260 [Candidatus Competibacterales bacterium]
MARRRKEGDCDLCGRSQPLSFHHLIPRRCHGKTWFRKTFDKAEMKTRGLDICYDCHAFLHRQFDERELGKHLNTREALLAHEDVVRFIQWVRKKK